MQLATSVDAFVARPVGRYFLSENFLLWCATPVAAGTVVWGTPEESSVALLLQGWSFERQLQTPYSSVVDLGAVTAMAPEVFANVAAYMQQALPTLSTRMHRQALVRPSGMFGAVVAGFYPVLQPGFSWRDFANRNEAFAWCWSEEPSWQAELFALLDGCGSASLLVKLRALLLTQGTDRSLAQVARRLGVSTRSLQRVLQAESTTLRTEVQRARMTLACRYLLETDEKIEHIAKKLGVASASSFVTMFRLQMGETPAEFRAKRCG